MEAAATALEVMKVLPVGAALYDTVFVEDKPMIALFVKEEDAYINKWGKYPVVELRTGLMKIGKVMVCPLIANVNKNPDLLYETWINYHANFGEGVFGLLQEQENILIIMTNEDNVSRRTISIKNTFDKDMIADIRKRLKTSDPWTMAEFDKAKNAIINKYPSVVELWRALQ